MVAAPYRKRACVIGAGASGLACITQLLEKGLDVVAYEARAQVGGAWLVEPAQHCVFTFDKRGMARVTQKESLQAPSDMPCSAMYPSLRTNIPQNIMQYKDVPFHKETHLFPGPDRVQAYIEEYAKPLMRFVQLRTKVTRLRWSPRRGEPSGRRWQVETMSESSTGQINARTEDFDFVAIANGHYSEPSIPYVPGLKDWKGKLSHSRFYRSAEAMRGETVMVVGTSASGYDIVRELAQMADGDLENGATEVPRVYQSMRTPSPLAMDFTSLDAPRWAKRIEVHTQMRRIETDEDGRQRIIFEDGRVLTDVTTIIFATGYLYSFPFCQSTDEPWASHPLTVPPPVVPPPGESAPDVPGDDATIKAAEETVDSRAGVRVHNLDKRQLFYMPDPSLALICLNLMVIPFPLAEVQSRVVATAWANLIKLDYERDFKDDEESKKVHVYGYPYEFEVQDALLEDIGEGVEGIDGKWPKKTPLQHELRANARPLRRQTLGY